MIHTKKILPAIKLVTSAIDARAIIPAMQLCQISVDEDGNGHGSRTTAAAINRRGRYKQCDSYWTTKGLFVTPCKT